MKLTTILFDLDGTLLPMVQEEFVKEYFRLLVKKAAPLGYEPEKLIDTLWKGTGAMVENDGSCANQEAFWRTFAQVYGQQALKDRPVFDDFYVHEFAGAQSACGFDPKAASTVKRLQEQGYDLILATNPIFPAPAVEHRIRWAGLEPEDFQMYTTYENSCHCKPNPAYYQDILDRLGLRPEQCLMVGNDVEEDMVAAATGMGVFLLTPCLIHRGGGDLSVYPQGDFDALLNYLQTRTDGDEPA